MKKVDFLIYYEHINREIENICLLSAELKRRGYSTIIRKYGSWTPVKPKVVLTPFLYSTDDIYPIVYGCYGRVEKIINLQWEQVRTPELENNRSLYPDGWAIYAQHLAWGTKTWDKLREIGVSKKNIAVTGNIALDLNFKYFDKLFLSREEISNIYSLDNKKKWHLFISSFAYSNLDKSQINGLKSKLYNLNYLIEIHKSSQIELISWFDSYLKTHMDIIIYRPHPAECLSEKVLELDKKYTNFKIIKDYSIRQWIRICDTVSNWISTSIADTYVLGKSCSILRPITIPQNLDMALLDRPNTYLKSYKQFVEFLDGKYSIQFPCSDETMLYWYGENNGKNYMKVADFCIEVLNGNKYEFNYNSRMRYNIKKRTWLLRHQIYINVSKYINLQKFISKDHKTTAYSNFLEQRNINRLIEKYEDAFKVIIDESSDKE